MTDDIIDVGDDRSHGARAIRAPPGRPDGAARSRDGESAPGRDTVEISGGAALRLAWRMQWDRIGVLEELAPHRSAVVVSIFPKRFVFLFDAADVAPVLGEAYAAFDRGLGVRHARHALGNGMLSADGEIWRRSRLALARVMGQGAAATSALAGRRYIRHRLAGLPPGPTEIAVADLAAGTAAEALGVGLFGLRHGDDIRALLPVLRRILEPVRLGMTLPQFTGVPFLLRSRPGEKRALDELIAWTDDRIAAARNSPSDSVISFLAHQAGFDDRQIRDETITLLVAGLETTAAALAWCLLHLAARPDWCGRIRREAESDEEAERVVRPQAGAAWAFVSEVLRLRPPVWMLTRRARLSLRLPHVLLRPGDDVLIPIWSLHRDPRYWREAKVFQPERFIGPGAAPPACYMPFGAGPRICVGRRIGLGVLVEAVREVIGVCDLAPGTNPGRVETRIGLTLEPGHGATVTAIRRATGSDALLPEHRAKKWNPIFG